MKKILWCDVETTGLDSNKHGIIQLALLMDIDNKIVDSLLLNIQPFDEDMTGFVLNEQELNFGSIKENTAAMDEAKLPVGNLKYADLLINMSPKDAYNKLTAFLNKYINRYEKVSITADKKAWFGGYNAQFDLNFMKQFFLKNGDKWLASYIRWRLLDPMYLLYNQDYLVEEDKRLPSMKLGEVCIHYEIDHIPHDPMSDIKATRKLWYMLMRLKDVT